MPVVKSTDDRFIFASSWAVLLLTTLLSLTSPAHGFMSTRVTSTSTTTTTTAIGHKIVVGGRKRSLRFILERQEHMLHNKKNAIIASSLSSKVEDSDDNGGSSSSRIEAEKLLKKAQELRNEINEQKKELSSSTTATATTSVTTEINAVKKNNNNKWNVIQEEDNDDDDDGSSSGIYRLYCDIGQEDGTWMDPRWGASGKRIEFTLDIQLTTVLVMDKKVKEAMVKDNFGGKSSNIYILKSGPNARLRSGFDSMKCAGGAYRLDTGGQNGNSGGVLRFYVKVDGSEKNAFYGDVNIPEGYLYFSIPCFGNGGGSDSLFSQLSIRDSPITVRQIGWHTGFRRMESRIVGIFKAKPLDQALKKKDKY